MQSWYEIQRLKVFISTIWSAIIYNSECIYFLVSGDLHLPHLDLLRWSVWFEEKYMEYCWESEYKILDLSIAKVLLIIITKNLNKTSRCTKRLVSMTCRTSRRTHLLRVLVPILA